MNPCNFFISRSSNFLQRAIFDAPFVQGKMALACILRSTPAEVFISDFPVGYPKVWRPNCLFAMNQSSTIFASVFTVSFLVALAVFTGGCVTDPAGNTPLILAARKGNTEQVNALLQKNADANSHNREGTTALMAATWGGDGRGNTQIARTLIAHGADVNATNMNGRTALMEAAGNGNTDFVGLLVEHGADVNAALSTGQTALMEAALNGRIAIVHILLEHGADPNAINGEGHTALIWAAGKGHVEIVRMLLEHHADARAKDFQGKTALEWATRAKKMDIVQILKEAAPND
jgi:ankyrin repeat protein